jgi:hypothetical protein
MDNALATVPESWDIQLRNSNNFPIRDPRLIREYVPIEKRRRLFHNNAHINLLQAYQIHMIIEWRITFSDMQGSHFVGDHIDKVIDLITCSQMKYWRPWWWRPGGGGGGG